MITSDYKAIFKQGSALVVVMDTKFTILDASDAYLKETKTTREDIVGRDIFHVFPDNPNDIAGNGESEIRASFNRVLKNKTVDTLEVVKYHIPKPESEGGGFVVKYWRPCHSPVLDEFNNVKYIVQRVEEVTENEALAELREAEKKTLKQIEESNKRYHTMLMHSPFAFSVMKGKDMVITLANDLMKEFWGKGNDVEGKTLLEILPELKGQAFPGMMDKVLTTGVPVYANEILAQLKRNGKMEDRYFNIVYQPHHEADATISGVTTIATDVTQQVLTRKIIEESENRYRMLIEESSVAAALYLGPEMRVQYANDIMLTYFGKNKSDVIGKPIMEALPELEGQPFINYFEAVYNSGRPYIGIEEKADLFIDGRLQTFYFDFTYKALKNSEGNIYGIHHMAVDVTSQVVSKKELEESEKQFRLLTNTMPQKISTADADGNIIFFNQPWLEDTGYTYEELKGWGWEKVMHPEDWGMVKKRWQQSVLTGDIFDVECRILNTKGEFKWHLGRALPVKDENGKIIMWVGSNTDIHAQKEQKEELEKAVTSRTKQLIQKNAELEDANKELISFTYVSSHDLQEPLRKIQNFASFIMLEEEKNLSETGKGYFLRMRQIAQRMQELIEDLLKYSRAKSSERMIEKTDLNLILNEVKADYEEVIQHKKAIFDTTNLGIARIIRLPFRQVLQNLLSNSLKFSRPDTPPHIMVKSEIGTGSDFNHAWLEDGEEKLLPQKKYCHITFTDNGIGFDPQYKNRIFEVFQRLHTFDEYTGTGIGLAICKRIIENHSGIITATGKLQEGARFDIYIPA